MERVDPENNETRALDELVNLNRKRVLEVGCGDGRLTWRYADRAAHVTAIDPAASQIAAAIGQLSEKLKHRIEFRAIEFEDFAAACTQKTFDVVILSNSLC